MDRGAWWATVHGIVKSWTWLIWKDWCWERLKEGGEGDGRGWDGWMASPTQWKWFWVNSGNWWWTGRSVMLQSIGLQRVGHEGGTDWTERNAVVPPHHGSPACTVSWTMRALICLQNTTRKACLACSSPTHTHTQFEQERIPLLKLPINMQSI